MLLAPTATARRAAFPLAVAARPALRSQLLLQPPSAYALRRGLTNQSAEEIKLRQSESKREARTPTLFRPLYTSKDVEAVQIAHFKPQTLSDKVAFGMIYMARSIFDLATRYRHPEFYPRVKGWEHPEQEQALSPGYRVRLPPSAQKDGPDGTETMELSEMRRRGISMTPDAWMVRIVFLETVAGIPGLVAAACRQLQSLRLMRRDKGWIHTLLEDSENERMHLLTAMQYVGHVGPFMRLMILAAQGVYWNMFFAMYLVAPKAAHRFVGALEEEAVITYTAIIEDIEQGRLPEWKTLPAVDIAKEYWGLPDNATMQDVMYAIRADEATHRFVNHTLGSLDPKKDFNPFANHIPSPQLRGSLPGLTPEEARNWSLRAQADAHKKEAPTPEQPSLMNKASTEPPPPNVTSQLAQGSNDNPAEEVPSSARRFVGLGAHLCRYA